MRNYSAGEGQELVTFLIGFIKYYLMDYQVIIFFGNVTHKTIRRLYWELYLIPECISWESIFVMRDVA